MKVIKNPYDAYSELREHVKTNKDSKYGYYLLSVATNNGILSIDFLCTLEDSGLFSAEPLKAAMRVRPAFMVLARYDQDVEPMDEDKLMLDKLMNGLRILDCVVFNKYLQDDYYSYREEYKLGESEMFRYV